MGMLCRGHVICSLAIFLAAFLAGGPVCLAETGQDQPAQPVDRGPVWSPDGKMIAFVSTRGGKDASTNIWVMSSDGTTPRQLTSRGTNDRPTWSPDGTKIAFQSGAEVWQADLATRGFTLLMQGERPWSAPDWHPKDASKLACTFKTYASGDADIWILNPQTCLTRPSGRQVARERDGSDENPRWSRDGSRIAFAGESIDKVDRKSHWYLMTMRPDGTDLRTHCEIAGRDCRPSWFPGGSSILIDGGRVCELATGSVRSLLGQDMKDGDISPDGKRVAYSRLTPGIGQLIFVAKTDGTEKPRMFVLP